MSKKGVSVDMTADRRERKKKHVLSTPHDVGQEQEDDDVEYLPGARIDHSIVILQYLL